MYLSELVAKRVIALKSAEDAGMVIGAYVDKWSYQCVYLCLDSGKVVELKDIISTGEVITVYDSPTTPIDTQGLYKITTTQEVILVSGVRLGRVKDMLLAGRGKKGELNADKGNIKLKTIVGVSDNIITANPTYRILNKEDEIPNGKILTIEGKVDESETNQPINSYSLSPYDFLIGKRVSQEVSDISRSFVLMAGTIITERVIENARRAGKLSDLVNKSK